MEDMVVDQERVDAWKKWWNEVKTGKRTYRFKGSSIEYVADGPATKEQIERISMHRRMESDREARHRMAGGASDVAKSETRRNAPLMALTIVLSLAGFAVMAAAVWYFARARDRWGH